MTIRKPLILSAIILATMLFASLLAWPAIPDGTVAVHFDVHGKPNGFAPKPVALLLLPTLGAMITGYMTVLATARGDRERLQNSTIPYSVTWSGGIIFLGAIHLMLIAYALGYAIDFVRLVGLILAGFLMLTGNYYGKMRYNYAFGLRTPWTLADERVWDKTHRFMGRAMVTCGAVLMIMVLVVASPVAVTIGMAALAGLPVVAATIYSATRPASRLAR